MWHAPAVQWLERLEDSFPLHLSPSQTDTKQWNSHCRLMNSEVHFLKPPVFPSRSIQTHPGTKDFPMLGTCFMSDLLWQLVSGSLYLIEIWCAKVYSVFRKPNTLQIWSYERGKWRGMSFRYWRLLVLGSGVHSVIFFLLRAPLPCLLRNVSVALRKMYKDYIKAFLQKIEHLPLSQEHSSFSSAWSGWEKLKLIFLWVMVPGCLWKNERVALGVFIK